MASRKKAPIEVKEVAVESIIWRDAQMKMREPLSTDSLVNMTVGFVVHEDEGQVILAHEVTYTTAFMHDDMDYTKIPKVLIVSRTPLGRVRLDGEAGDHA